MAKNIYKNGLEYMHKETKRKIRFLKWLDENNANCIDKDMNFIQLTREELDNNYISVAAHNKQINQRRQGQMWSY